jgi:hypothetical protein
MKKTFRWAITARKAAVSFGTYAGAIGAALATVDLPEGATGEGAAIALGIGAIAAVARAVNNVRKNSHNTTYSGY